MKFYVTRYGASGAKRISWQGTQADAAAKRKDLKEQDCDGIETIEFEVPTDKPALLAFLNTHVTGEFGARQIEEMFRQKFNPQQVSKL